MVRSQPFQGCNAGSNPVEDTKTLTKTRGYKMGNTYYKWYFITAIVGIIMFGIYKTTEMSLDRMEHMQEVSRQVIEK